MRAVERARHRSTLEPLSQLALSIQPAVKDRVACAETWQQRADNIQARCNVEAPRKQLINGVLVNPGQGALGNSTAHKENKAILSAQPVASRVIIKAREDITNYFNRIAPQDAIDYGSHRMKFYDALIETVHKTDQIERRREVARATVASLRRAGSNCEMWTDGTVASDRKGLGVAQYYRTTDDVSDREWKVRMSSGTCSTSYDAELCGVTVGLQEILARDIVEGRQLAIYVDCKGLVTGLAQGRLR